MGWVSPTGHDDPDSAWSAESSSYDGNTNTKAYTETADKYLELNRAAISCDKVRVYIRGSGITSYGVQFDVWYGGAWHNIHDGGMAVKVWVELEVGSTEIIDKLRTCMHSGVSRYNFYEAEFNEGEAPPPSYISQLMMIT